MAAQCCSDDSVDINSDVVHRVGHTEKADHNYFKWEDQEERTPSFLEHSYNKSTPKKSAKRKRDFSSPTGTTPIQVSKSIQLNDGKCQVRWSNEEKDFIRTYMKDQTQEPGAAFWSTCAQALNAKFPGHNRNGESCRRMSQRLTLCSSQNSHLISTEIGNMGDLVLIAPTSVDAQTQTYLSLPPNITGLTETDRLEDWVFMEPKKDLKESAGKGARMIHAVALKRLRTFPDLKQSERASLIDLLCTGSAQQIARAIMTSTLFEHIKTLILFDIEMDARECTNLGSTLYSNKYQNLTDFSWEKVIEELLTKQSFLAEALLAASLPTAKIGNSKDSENLIPVIGTIYGMLMKLRFRKLNLVQKVVSVVLANEQTHQKVYDCLQPIGISLSHTGMLDTMTLISGSFNDQLIKAVTEKKKFRIVGDNVNFHVSVSKERGSVGKRSHMEHWFASAAIIQNPISSVLNNDSPQEDLRRISTNVFVPCDNEWKDFQIDLATQAARILCDFFPWLRFAKSALQSPVKAVPTQMKSANMVIPLPIEKKNEQKYSDVVDILDSYQELVEKTFRASGQESQQVHIGGDQLTRERFTGAKRLRAGSLTASERYESLYPVTFELFHLQMSMLTLFYNILYSTQHTDSFTLYSQKVRLLRKDADGNDVKNHYDSCRDLAFSFIRAYVVEAACEFFGLPDLTTVPENIPDSSNMSVEEIRLWLINQILPVIEKATEDTKACLFGTDTVPDTSDHVNIYGNLVLELGLMYICLCDVIKCPNRERLLTLMKFLLLLFKGHNNNSKYALEILRFLCQQLALLTEQQAEETCYGLFVNTGKTIIPADLVMEHLVRLTKGHLRAMCSNVTENSLIKRSSSFCGMDEVSKNFYLQTDVITRSQKHKTLSSIEDEKKIVLSLRDILPFSLSTGRCMNLRKKPKQPFMKLNFDEFILWIEKHKCLLYYEL